MVAHGHDGVGAEDLSDYGETLGEGVTPALFLNAGPEQIDQLSPRHTRRVSVDREVHQQRQLLFGAESVNPAIRVQERRRSEHSQVERTLHCCSPMDGP